jgi:uncharacterized RDD family membrane protein YckC
VGDLFVSAYWIYSVSLHAYRGQTVGKKAQHIRVMDVSEEKLPSLKQAMIRDIGTIVLSSSGFSYFVYLVVTHRYTDPLSLSTSWPLYILGFANLGWFPLEIVTMFTNSKRRAFHDLIAGTVVVRVDKPGKDSDFGLIGEA